LAKVTNYDLFEELFIFIKKDNTSISDVVKEYGGANLYIPSYKATFRNSDICKEYIKRQNEKAISKQLAKKYDLSEVQILQITKEVRATLL